MYIINLVTGDLSDDDHGKTDSEILYCSHKKEDIWEAYNEGSKKLEFDLKEKVATDYESSYISEAYLKILVDNGYNNGIGFDYDAEEKNYYLFPEDYVDIFKFIVKLGNSEIVFEEIATQVLNIGGYGLFH